MISHKYSAMSAKEAQEDLRINHGRTLSKKYLQQISETVSAVVASKEDNWEYAPPAQRILSIFRGALNITLS